ncbi:hypothetical protein [Bacillus sp. ISL-7]|uniref:hypothetical protein n=1 Tax=Bacillus sp. ISL-7 TaxID=2819136 RepID=UPI0020355E2D|nr:hypothetical protein [Bacillus sp. ISL-7]
MRSKAANFMALNLMNDIVTGKRTVEDARRAAVEIEKAFRLKGQSSPYTTGSYSQNNLILLIPMSPLFRQTKTAG